MRKPSHDEKYLMRKTSLSVCILSCIHLSIHRLYKSHPTTTTKKKNKEKIKANCVLPLEFVYIWKLPVDFLSIHLTITAIGTHIENAIIDSLILVWFDSTTFQSIYSIRYDSLVIGSNQIRLTKSNSTDTNVKSGYFSYLCDMRSFFFDLKQFLFEFVAILFFVQFPSSFSWIWIRKKQDKLNS